jgi:hypothetical protein
MKELTFTPQQIFQIYKCSYSIEESRGKKRQHLINSIIIESLKNNNNYDDCQFFTETRIKNILWGKYFSIDIEVHKNGKLIEIILAKAPASNITQNSVNSLNGKAGEMSRLTPILKDGVKLTFITFQPVISPFFTNSGIIKHFENNKVRTINSLKENNVNVDFLDILITFNIEGIESCENRKDVQTIFSKKNIIGNIKLHA